MVALCHRINIDITVAISIPIYTSIWARSFHKHCAWWSSPCYLEIFLLLGLGGLICRSPCGIWWTWKKKGGKTTTEVEIINTIWFLTKHRRKQTQTSIFNHCYCRVFRTFARTLDLNVSWSLQNMRSPRSWEAEQHAVDPTTVGHKGGTGKLKRGKGGVQLPQLLYVSDGNKFFPVREPSVINATRSWKVDEYTPQPCFLLHSPPYLFYNH